MDASRDSLALSLRFGRWGKFITNGWNSTESVYFFLKLEMLYRLVPLPKGGGEELTNPTNYMSISILIKILEKHIHKIISDHR